MSRFARVALLAILLTLSAQPAMADWTQDFVRIACNPDARFFRFEHVGLPGGNTWSDARNDDKLRRKRETIWKQHGFYVPSDVHYECKLGDVTYRLNTTQRAKSDSDTRNATPPIRLNLTRNGDEIIKDVWLDDSSGGPAVSSVTIFEPTAGWESGDTVICAWPEPTPATGPYRDVCAPVSLFSPTMPVTQEKMETYLRRYLQK